MCLWHPRPKLFLSLFFTIYNVLLLFLFPDACYLLCNLCAIKKKTSPVRARGLCDLLATNWFVYLESNRIPKIYEPHLIPWMILWKKKTLSTTCECNHNANENQILCIFLKIKNNIKKKTYVCYEKKNTPYQCVAQNWNRPKTWRHLPAQCKFRRTNRSPLLTLTNHPFSTHIALPPPRLPLGTYCIVHSQIVK